MSTGLRLVSLIAVVALCFPWTVSCKGGESPATPSETFDTPRHTLDLFADACLAQDIEAACACLLNPGRWRHTLELGREALPMLGESLKGAEERERERDRIRYRFTIRQPNDPFQRTLESSVYVSRLRDSSGRAGKWGVDFIKTPTSVPSRERQAETGREAQWGTLACHASIISRAILAYYFLKYPDDYLFNGTWGYFNPYKYFLSVSAAHPGPIETILFSGYDTYENIPPDAVLILNVASALLQAGSADEDVFVGELNEDGTVNFLRDIVLNFGGPPVFSTTVGFADDDDTLLKGFAHFLTPVTQDAWQSEFAPFDDMSLLGGTGGASVKALDWALGEGVLGPYDVLGVLNMRASRNRKTFQRAVELIRQARVTSDGIEAARLLVNSFYTMGWVMHLLEDLSCPAHARNDMHGVPVISSIPGLGSLQPDPAEEWAETFNQSFINETISLYKQVLKKPPIARNEEGFPGDQILQNLFVTAGHSDYPAVEAIFEYTALLTNRMCFSEDTIYRSTNPGAANTDYYPDLTALYLDFFGRSVVYGTPGAPISTESCIVACGNGLFDWWRSWFWMTHGFKDPKVQDVEDALRNGWDILTVADDADEDYYSNSVLGVREQQWRLMFPHIVRTGAALMHEYYLEAAKE